MQDQHNQTKLNIRSPKRPQFDNYESSMIGAQSPFDGTIICHVWNPNPESNILALSSTIHPSRIYICSVIINEERNHADHFKVEIIHHFDSCHDKPILSLDWSDSDDNKTSACTNGRIVSCAEDCRAFIWVFDDHRGMWKSTQIFLNNCLAPLYCKWSRGGEKVAFAMGGDKKSASLHVYSFDVKTQEWMSRPVGKQQIKASALHLSWRPIIMGEDGNTQEFLASGGCDYKCRIFWISNDKHEERFGGEQVAEFLTRDKSWVTCVAWSECGQTLAFSTHSSQIHVVDDMRCLDGKSDQMVSRIIVQDTFPLRSLIFTGKNNILIAAGYDGTIFSVDASTKTQINKTYRKLKPWKDSLSRNGADGIISCLQISNVGAAGSHVSASGSQGTFLIMNI